MLSSRNLLFTCAFTLCSSSQGIWMQMLCSCIFQVGNGDSVSHSQEQWLRPAVILLGLIKLLHPLQGDTSTMSSWSQKVCLLGAGCFLESPRHTDLDYTKGLCPLKRPIGAGHHRKGTRSRSDCLLLPHYTFFLTAITGLRILTTNQNTLSHKGKYLKISFTLSYNIGKEKRYNTFWSSSISTS
jgi:hypothetical protein